MGEATALRDVALHLTPTTDKVAIAKTDLPVGLLLSYQGYEFSLQQPVAAGHRFAVQAILTGEFIYQNGNPFACSRGIACGELIGVDNTEERVPLIEQAVHRPPPETELNPKYTAKSFSGYLRRDGKVGTRNYYLIVPASMCCSAVATQIAERLRSEVDLTAIDNLDGVVALPHTEGCGCASGGQIERLLRVLTNYLAHPNVGGALIIDLGCEQSDAGRIRAQIDPELFNAKPLDFLTIQQSGGTRATIEKAVALAKERLADVAAPSRQPQPLSKLVVGTQCGASDSFSGVTANPLMGALVDRVVAAGGAGILSEIPELVGTYDMLYCRFRNHELAGKFRSQLEWYGNLAERLGVNFGDNLVPKNIEGGLINSFLKSLGAAMKGGSTPIEGVIDYAEQVQNPGLNIMQGPGGDPESVTGIVAGGANLVCFSTGYGAITGNAICPVIKISSNSAVYTRLPDDFDFDAGQLLESSGDLNRLADELLEQAINICSGESSCTEQLDQRQFQIWTAGKLAL